MEPEIELERFAALCAEVEAGTPLDEVLRIESLPAGAWSESRNAWMERMSREPEATRNALEARYKAAFEARLRAIEARKASKHRGDGEELTPPRAQAMPLSLMDTVPMLPTADPEQLLARLRARRAAAAQAAAEGATPPPAATGAPAVKGPPPPPRESKLGPGMAPQGDTPPMRPRIATIPDPLPARSTTPPAPAGVGKPALPFQAAPHAPLPPPPPGAMSSAGPTSGGAPVSSASYQRPTPIPMPPTVPQPMTLAGFPAVDSGPQLSLERYAAFAAEIAVNPAAMSEIRTKYGLSDAAHTTETEAWQRRFAADRDTYVRYATLYQHYRDWFAARGPR